MHGAFCIGHAHRYLAYWVHVNEYVAMQLHALTLRHGRLAMVQQVCDFDAASLSLLYPPFYVFAAPWVKMTQRNYPNIASAIHFVHPPRFIAALWKLLTPLFDPDTVRKMRVEPPELAFEPPEGATALPPPAELGYLRRRGR